MAVRLRLTGLLWWRDIADGDDHVVAALGDLVAFPCLEVLVVEDDGDIGVAVVLELDVTIAEIGLGDGPDQQVEEHQLVTFEEVEDGVGEAVADGELEPVVSCLLYTSDAADE